VKPVGEPDALIGHVRFDERGWETERCRGAQATAPILDSTLADIGILTNVRLAPEAFIQRTLGSIRDVRKVPKPEISPKPLDARAVRFSEPRKGYAWSLGSALATSRAYLANNSVTS